MAFGFNTAKPLEMAKTSVRKRPVDFFEDVTQSPWSTHGKARHPVEEEVEHEDDNFRTVKRIYANPRSVDTHTTN